MEPPACLLMVTIVFESISAKHSNQKQNAVKICILLTKGLSFADLTIIRNFVQFDFKSKTSTLYSNHYDCYCTQGHQHSKFKRNWSIWMREKEKLRAKFKGKPKKIMNNISFLWYDTGTKWNSNWKIPPRPRETYEANDSCDLFWLDLEIFGQLYNLQNRNIVQRFVFELSILMIG